MHSSWWWISTLAFKLIQHNWRDIKINISFEEHLRWWMSTTVWLLKSFTGRSPNLKWRVAEADMDRLMTNISDLHEMGGCSILSIQPSRKCPTYVWQEPETEKNRGCCWLNMACVTNLCLKQTINNSERIKRWWGAWKQPFFTYN